MNPTERDGGRMKPRKLALIFGIIFILVAWAFMYWLLVVPVPPTYRSPTPQERQRIDTGREKHGNWPVESAGDRLWLVSDKGQIRI